MPLIPSTTSPNTQQRTYDDATANQDSPHAVSTHADSSTMLNNFLNYFKATIISPYKKPQQINSK